MAGLDPTLAAIKRNLPSVARSLGFAARVTSGYRSRSAQTKLYKRYLAGLQPYPVAVPGTSDHERGLALDVVSTDTPKLVDLLASVGLRWAGEADPVHFTMVGAQIASQSGILKSIGKAYSEAASLYVDFHTPAPLRILDFLSDPIGSIESNISTAFNVILGL